MLQLKHIVSSSEAEDKRTSVLFMQILHKENDFMAKAKYTKGSDGYFQAKVWDGTYTDLGKKHYISLRTDKSSRALERMVNEHNRAVEERRLVKKTDMLFTTYAKTWRDVYKANREKNTLAMYDRIISKFKLLEGVRLCDISRMHYQTVINSADGHPRTQQQIALTFIRTDGACISAQLLHQPMLPDPGSVDWQSRGAPGGHGKDGAGSL